MDIEGEARHPSKTGLMRLATTNSLKASWASGTIERMALVAGDFKSCAKNYEIRPATRSKITKAIEENRKRML